MKVDGKYQALDKDRQRIYNQWSYYSLREKIQYIFSYYGVAIVIAIIAIGCAVFFISDFRKEKIEDAFYVMVIDSDIEEAQVTQLQEELSQILELDTTTQQCVVEADYSGSSNMQSAATISTYMQSGRVDLLVAKEEDFNLYASTGYLSTINYNGIAQEDLFYAEQVDYSSGGAVREIPYHPHDKTEYSDCYGVYIRDGIFDGYVVGVMSNSGKDNYNQKGLEYFLSANNKY
jgi:hypothetical protein